MPTYNKVDYLGNNDDDSDSDDDDEDNAHPNRDSEDAAGRKQKREIYQPNASEQMLMEHQRVHFEGL